MVQSAVQEVVTLLALMGAIWLVGALYIRITDRADQRRVAVLAQRRAQLTRGGKGPLRSVSRPASSTADPALPRAR